MPEPIFVKPSLVPVGGGVTPFKPPVKPGQKQKAETWQSKADEYMKQVEELEVRKVGLSENLERLTTKPAESKVLEQFGLSKVPGLESLVRSVSGFGMPSYVTMSELAKGQLSKDIKDVTNQIASNIYYSRVYQQMPAYLSVAKAAGDEPSAAMALVNIGSIPTTMTGEQYDNLLTEVDEMIEAVLPAYQTQPEELPEMALEATPPELPELEAPVQITGTPVSINQLTIEEIRKALTTPMAPVSTLSREEFEQFLADSGQISDKADLETVQFYREQAQSILDQWREQDNMLQAYREGIADTPEFKAVDLLKELVVMPGLGLLDVGRFYFEHVSQPLAGAVYKTIIPDIDAAYDRYKKEEGTWKALAHAWEEWDAPGDGAASWMLKYLLMEGLTDPLSYVGWGLGGKIVRPIPFIGRRLSAVVGGIERGIASVFELPFDMLKAGLRRLPKTLGQRATIAMHQAGQYTEAALTGMFGKALWQMNKEEMRKGVTKIIDYTLKHPNVDNELTRAGAQLLKHEPLDEQLVWRWAQRLNTTLSSEHITKQTVETVDRIFEDMLQTISKRGKVMTPKEAASRLVAELSGTGDGIIEVAQKLMADHAKNIISRGMEVGVTKSPLKSVRALMRRNYNIYIKAEESAVAIAQKEMGAMSSRLHQVPQHVAKVWSNSIDKWIVRPFAESYLAFALYGPMNVLEDIIRSSLGSVVPWTRTYKAFTRKWYGTTYDQMLGTAERGFSETFGALRKRHPGEVNNWILQMGGLAKGFGDRLYGALVEFPGRIGMGVRLHYIDAKATQILKELAGEQFEKLAKVATKFEGTGYARINKEVNQVATELAAMGAPREAFSAAAADFTRTNILRREVDEILMRHPSLNRAVRDRVMQTFNDGELFAEAGVRLDKVMPAQLFWYYGSKRQLFPKILPKIGYVHGNIIDPFFGTGAIPIGLRKTGNLGGRIIGYESSPDVLRVFRSAKSNPDGVMDTIRSIYGDKLGITKDDFIHVRNEYNSGGTDVEQAARFIVLSRHSFNNTIKYNKAGKMMQAPRGNTFELKYTKEFESNMREALASAGEVDVRQATATTYIDAIRSAKPGDVVYLDPPYLGRVEGKYPGEHITGEWTEESHRRMLQEAKLAADRGVRVVISASEQTKDMLTEVGASVSRVKVTSGTAPTELVATLGPEPMPPNVTTVGGSINDFIREQNDVIVDDFLNSAEHAWEGYEGLARELTALEVRSPEEMAQLMRALNFMSTMQGATPRQIMGRAVEKSRGLPLADRKLTLDKAMDTITVFRERAGASTTRVTEHIKAQLSKVQSPQYVTEAERLFDLQTSKRLRASELGEQANAFRHEYFVDATKADMKNPDFWDDYSREISARWDTYDVSMAEFDAMIDNAVEDLNKLAGVATPSRPPIKVKGQLSTNDIAMLIGCRGDDISRAILDVMVPQNSRNHFVAYVMGKVKPGDEGFTKESVGAVYDSLMNELVGGAQNASWVAGQKLELEAVRRDLHTLYNSKLLPDEEIANIGRYMDDVGGKVEGITTELVPGNGKRPATRVVKGEYANYPTLKQQAMDEAHKWYYKEFTDYTNANAFDAILKAIYPFWTYESQRWFWLPRSFIRHPGTWSTFERWQDNTDYGYVHIPNTSIDINPFRGTIYGTLTTRLSRRDYPEYYDSMDAAGDLLEFNDFLSRYGFYPGTHVTLPIAMFGGEEMQFGEVQPALVKTPLDVLIALFPDNDSVRWISDHVFGDRFRNYLTILTVNKMGGKGSLIFSKQQENEALTSEEEQLWSDARREVGWYSAGFEQFALFRMRTDEQTRMYKEASKAIEGMTGFTPEQQDWLREHGYQLWDMIGGLSPSQQKVLEELGYYKYVGQVRPLLPGKQQDILNKIELAWNDVEVYSNTILEKKLQLQRDLLSGARGSSDYNGELLELYDDQRKYIDSKIEEYPLMALENRKDYYKEYGQEQPVLHPMKELANLFFSIELQETIDPETGEKVMDWDNFWAQRMAIEQAVPDEYMQEWQDFLAKNSTRLEEIRREVYTKYFRPYNMLWEEILSTYPEDEQKMVNEYLYLKKVNQDMPKQEQIQNTVSSKTGNKLISSFQSEVSDARRALRYANPHLDAWLLYWGKVGTTIAPGADEYYQQIAKQTGRKV